MRLLKKHVKCSYKKLMPVDAVKPNPRNPNRHPQFQIELLAEIIKDSGWRAPITISNRSGLVVRGHGRLMAARLLELDKVPVEYQDYETQADEMADLVGDNKIQEFSYLDPGKVKDLLERIQDSSQRIMTAFDEDEINRVMGDHTGFLDDLLDDGGDEAGDNSDVENQENPDEGEAAAKFYKLPLEFTFEERDRIVAAVSEYQKQHNINLSSEALLAMVQEWETG